MKKLIIISLIILSYSANAQTKEETINWLSEKLSKYGSGCNEGVSNDGNYITIYDFFNEITYQLPFTGLSRIETYEWDGLYHGGRFTLYTFGNLITAKKSDGETLASKSSIDFSWSGCTGDPWSSEDNLLSRLVKAFKTLISYNKKSRPSEAF